VSGLAKVQYWLRKEGEALPANDRHFNSAPWQDAGIVPFDAGDFKGLDGASLHPVQFDPKTRKPVTWPLRNTLCHWTATLPSLPQGKHEIRCRTIDLAGNAQPMPRPFPKSGKNDIARVTMEVTA
jgi:hypothetical protein